MLDVVLIMLGMLVVAMLDVSMLAAAASTMSTA
jgi:hypothetical protein